MRACAYLRQSERAHLASQCDRIVLMGTSKTAEAVLLYAAHDPRLDAIVALAPSHVAWANVGRGLDEAERLGTIPGPQVSQWS